MKIKYDYNILFKLYDILDKSIYYFLNGKIDNDKRTDDVIVDLVGYNGAKTSDYVATKTIEICDDTYICLLYGILGNEMNEVFDYLEIYGSSYIIVFMDYFKNIKTENIGNEDSLNMEEKLSYVMGNSTAFNGISQIVEFFIKLTSRVKPNSGTIQEKINSTAPTMIAAKILNDIKPLTENDCDGSFIPYERIMELLKVNIGDILIGKF